MTEKELSEIKDFDMECVKIYMKNAIEHVETAFKIIRTYVLPNLKFTTSDDPDLRTDGMGGFGFVHMNHGRVTSLALKEAVRIMEERGHIDAEDFNFE